MPKPNEVTIIRVSSIPFTDPQGRTLQGTSYTYNVGTFGPFVLNVSAADDTPEYVNAAFQAKLDSLRAVGAPV